METLIFQHADVYRRNRLKDNPLVKHKVFFLVTFCDEAMVPFFGNTWETNIFHENHSISAKTIDFL